MSAPSHATRIKRIVRVKRVPVWELTERFLIRPPLTLCDSAANRRKSENVMKALLQMKKLDVARLKEAYDQA